MMKKLTAFTTFAILAAATAANAGTVFIAEGGGSGSVPPATPSHLSVSATDGIVLNADIDYLPYTFSFDISTAEPSPDTDPDAATVFTGTYSLTSSSGIASGTLSLSGSAFLLPLSSTELVPFFFDLSGTLTHTTGDLPAEFEGHTTLDVTRFYFMVPEGFAYGFYAETPSAAAPPSAVPLPASTSMAAALAATTLLRRR